MGGVKNSAKDSRKSHHGEAINAVAGGVVSFSEDLKDAVPPPPSEEEIKLKRRLGWYSKNIHVVEALHKNCLICRVFLAALFYVIVQFRVVAKYFEVFVKFSQFYFRSSFVLRIFCKMKILAVLVKLLFFSLCYF